MTAISRFIRRHRGDFSWCALYMLAAASAVCAIVVAVKFLVPGLRAMDSKELLVVAVMFLFIAAARSR